MSSADRATLRATSLPADARSLDLGRDIRPAMMGPVASV